MTTERLRRWLGPALVVGLFVAALAAIHHQLAPYHLDQVLAALGANGPNRFALEMLLTAFSYLLLTLYDRLALRNLGYALSYSQTALASFVASAFSHTLGFATLAGASVRYRFYTASGVPAVDVAKIVVHTSLTFWLGFLGVGSVVLLAVPGPVAPAAHLSGFTSRPLGALLLALLVAYVVLVAIRQGKPPLVVRGHPFTLPDLRATARQLLLGSADWLVAASALYVLLPGASVGGFASFVGAFLVAQLGGAASQIPGGIGVFDSLILVLLGNAHPAPQILAALLTYRIVYYVLPLLAAAAISSARETVSRWPAAGRTPRHLTRWFSGAVPAMLSGTTFLSGVVLLLSGATPAAATRLAGLREILPLPLFEASHFLASLTGAALLLLARGLQRRLDAAYLLTLLLLGSGIAFSFAKGFDYEEAFFLLLMLAILLPCRRHFYRRASLLGEPFTPGWIAAVALVVLATAWVVVFSYKHVEYTHELWWRFAFDGDAPRSLRALAGAVGVMLFVGVSRLLRPARPSSHPVTAGELARARVAIASARDTMANLALLGDKSLLISDSGRGFVMFQARGRSLVALGDPVAPEEEAAELAWRFHELCDREGARTVFYQVSSDRLPLYLDMGLRLVKLGEEARVDLSTFTLQGSGAKGWRSVLNHVRKEGGVFEIVPRDALRAVLPELRTVSDAWLASKKTREKGFSLGFFSASYIENFDVAVMRREGAVVAFANLWTGADREEISPDLMRFDPRAPDGAVEALFLEIMQWGKNEGFRWFNLGGAPLAGLEPRPGCPIWNRIGAYVYRHGEHFYNFQGLRRFKQKFSPRWTPRYLAYPGGITLPRVLLDIATLSSRGLTGVIGK